MKRQGQLLEEIAELKNLYEAFYKAQKGKVSKRYVCAYKKQLQQNLKRLQQQLLSGAVSYTHLTLPTKRIV